MNSSTNAPPAQGDSTHRHTLFLHDGPYPQKPTTRHKSKTNRYPVLEYPADLRVRRTDCDYKAAFRHVRNKPWHSAHDTTDALEAIQAFVNGGAK